MLLSECRPGQSGRIVRVQAEDSSGRRLLELGFVQGASVRLLGIAPLGDPLYVAVQNSRFSLRRQDAQRIELSSK